MTTTRRESSKAELLFSPEPLSSTEPSLALSLKLGLILMDESARFLKDALFAKVIAPVTDVRVESLGLRMLTSSATTLVTYGRNHLEDKTAYVYMSNHLSFFDIPVLFVAVPNSLRMVAKAELLRIHLFGRGLLDSGFIVIDRKNHDKAISQIEKTKEQL